jgi:hypothetical protein
MKLKDKYHWNAFIYELIYPGFIGTMIYELIPTTKSAVSLATHLNFSTLTKILITIFYCVDYLHCYGDLNPKIKTENRTWIYLLCDVASSLFFFFAFVMVKLEQFQTALYLIAVVPVFFVNYKRENKREKKFHIPYLLISILAAFFCFLYLNQPAENSPGASASLLLFWFTFFSLITYCIYVFYYYEKYSKPEYKKLHEKATLNERSNHPSA